MHLNQRTIDKMTVTQVNTIRIENTIEIIPCFLDLHVKL